MTPALLAKSLVGADVIPNVLNHNVQIARALNPTRKLLLMGSQIEYHL